MSEPIELPHIDRIDYVGGSYPMAIKPDGEYVEYDDHVAIVRQLTEQRAELLEALRLFVEHAEEVDVGGGDAVVTTCESVQSARAAIANATQQRNATGGEG